MIANAVRLVDGNLDRPDVDASLSVPVLKAALEVGRQDRLWLKQKLTDRKSESDALREELQGLSRALPGPALVDGRASDQPVPAMTLATQLRRRLKSLWEERERLVLVLQEAAQERDEMAQSLKQATRDAQDAARRANQAVLAADAAVRERDALAAQLARQRAEEGAVSTPPATAHSPSLSPPLTPAAPPRSTDVDEIARALEIMAAALGDLRKRIEPWTTASDAAAAARGRCCSCSTTVGDRSPGGA